jgi:imidazole glycerol-phosphate synthase subunit HisH
MLNKFVCILDYGSGNVKSVYNMINYLGYKAVISNAPNDFENATHIILPGVGSFGVAMKKIKSQINISALEQQIIQFQKPFLGICVGMQVLVEKGYEHGEYDGLGWIPGTVEKINATNIPLPHIGWNEIKLKQKSFLFNGLDEVNDFYFVHSYVVKTTSNHVISETEYGVSFCSSIHHKNIYGVQFHPEKSQKAGQILFNNFLKSK